MFLNWGIVEVFKWVAATWAVCFFLYLLFENKHTNQWDALNILCTRQKSGLAFLFLWNKSEHRGINVGRHFVIRRKLWVLRLHQWRTTALQSKWRTLNGTQEAWAPWSGRLELEGTRKARLLNTEQQPACPGSEPFVSLPAAAEHLAERVRSVRCQPSCHSLLKGNHEHVASRPLCSALWSSELRWWLPLWIFDSNIFLW